MSAPRSLGARAPAKVNLGLFVGPRRADGRHQLVSVMQSISLADELRVEPAAGDGIGAPPGRDEVVCPGVPGPNLAEAALAAFREASGWAGAGVRLTVEKRIPVAAGLGGGSADAAATLRLAHALSGLGDDAMLLRLAGELGADVPAQVRPGRWLATGAGAGLQELPAPVAPLAVLVVPVAAMLSTRAVYAELDGMGALRSAGDLAEARLELLAELGAGAPLPRGELLVNDLHEPARALCPEIDPALAEVRAARPDSATVSGSGPTVVGLFGGARAIERARDAQVAMRDRWPAVHVATAVGPRFGAPVDLAVRHN